MWLTQMRTGAVSAVATKYMARPDASTMGIIGSGKEAPTQVAAVNCVRPLKHVKVYSRTPEHREAFAAETARRLGIDVEPVSSAEECTKGVDVVTTSTYDPDPVVPASWPSGGGARYGWSWLGKMSCGLAPSGHRSPSASTMAGGRLGMNFTRLPGFERSSAPDLTSVATGLSLSPRRASFTSLRRIPTRSWSGASSTSSMRMAALARSADLVADLGLSMTDLKMGEIVAGRYVAADPSGLTTTPGVWAAGNVADPRAQVINSAASGASAGATIHMDLMTEDTAIAVSALRQKKASHGHEEWLQEQFKKVGDGKTEMR